MAAEPLNEIRLGTLVTYIRVARKRPNFVLRAETMVDRVLFEGNRVTGVRTIVADGSIVDVRGDLVVITAGAYSTPPILQRSGIGPADDLQRVGVEPLADLPVGDNLLDHGNCAFVIRSESFGERLGRLFVTNCRAPLGTGGEPDWQAFPIPMDEIEGLGGIVVCLNRQDAQGMVRIRSDDPFEDPLIDHRYNSRESDFRRFEDAWEFFREAIERPAFKKLGAVEVTAHEDPRDVVLKGIGTAQHPVGTCRMGPPSDERTVIDSEFRVHGFEGLLVADSSIFPDNIMNNTNLTCYMIGELAADQIRGMRPAPVTAAGASTEGRLGA